MLFRKRRKKRERPRNKKQKSNALSTRICTGFLVRVFYLINFPVLKGSACNVTFGIGNFCAIEVVSFPLLLIGLRFLIIVGISPSPCN